MSDIYKLKLAHINDTHSHFEPTPIRFTLQSAQDLFTVNIRSGGYARIAYQVNHAKELAKINQQGFLFLHGGDSFQGTLYFSEYKGKANADLLNMLAPDAMVIGNHELDAGNAPILEFLNSTHFPILAGNMDLSKESSNENIKIKSHPNFYGYNIQTQTANVIIKPLQDKQIAIVGITIEDMHDIARPDPDTIFHNVTRTLENTINQLHGRNINHIIVLSHLGYNQDLKLARDVSGISLIVGGHTHTLQGDFSSLGLTNIPYGEAVNDTLIMHAGKYAETIGIADIEFNKKGQVTRFNGNNYFMLDKDFKVNSTSLVTSKEQDYVTQQLLDHPGILWDEENCDVWQRIEEKYQPKIKKLQNKILGHVTQHLTHTRLPSKLLPHGSEIAPWVSRSMFEEAKLLDKNVDFGLHNAGGVRQSLHEGDLTLAEIIGRLLPFNLPLVKYKIKGKYLYQLLESSINFATNNGVKGTGAGSFPYTYGLQYHYDGKKPMGQRITQLDVFTDGNWVTLNSEQYYIGVSSTYTASGKEGYQDILLSQWQKSLGELTLPQAFIQFVERVKTIDGAMPPQCHYSG